MLSNISEMIYIEPFGGICNRLRAIASAVWLSKQLNKPLTVIWQVNEDLNTSFESLFQLPGEFRVVENSRSFQNIKNSKQNNALKAGLSSIINKFYGVDFCIKEIEIKNYSNSYFTELKKYKNIYINTCEQFGEPSAYFSLFKPVPKIQKQINEISGHFDSYTVGLHIRRTDNAMAISNSPIELFFGKMDEEINDNPLANFFLATDDQEIEEELKKKYPGKIRFLESKEGRISKIGLEQAVVDLFCLGNTGKIFGSFYSSFSFVASKLNGNQLLILKTDTLNVPIKYKKMAKDSIEKYL
ncbi:hypothetical protein [Cognataquiflexum rubidum]|uniref:hypothetical protein n=1 Tax=Cognataquiflexum rubidum TaxID=2922273 RepID=UPI001F146A3E|nr:hypothetical protein [Cognataquiflexum rubidum]MCH6236503.1 hypothetical protein [Cognataquiflexum rubidum]